MIFKKQGQTFGCSSGKGNPDGGWNLYTFCPAKGNGAGLPGSLAEDKFTRFLLLGQWCRVAG